MTKALHKNSISHGDLHHENILVDKNGELKLLDYDSICIPELDGGPDVCRGRQNYQLPSRLSSPLIASVTNDYFSELIIYLSLKAIIEKPLLWKQYNSQQQKMLFNQVDFIFFNDTPIYKDLILLSNDVVELVRKLEEYLSCHRFLSPFN